MSESKRLWPFIIKYVLRLLFASAAETIKCFLFAFSSLQTVRNNCLICLIKSVVLNDINVLFLRWLTYHDENTGTYRTYGMKSELFWQYVAVARSGLVWSQSWLMFCREPTTWAFCRVLSVCIKHWRNWRFNSVLQKWTSVTDPELYNNMYNVRTLRHFLQWKAG